MKAVHLLAPFAFGKASPSDVMGVLSQLMPLGDILPKMPKIAERTTGEVMGESAEKMAVRNEISRLAQDELAFRSHERAAAAIESGRFDEEVVAVEPPSGALVSSDTIVRADTSIERLGKLRPVFAKDGTLTAGNSSTLTDGAASVLLMEEQKAKALGYTPLAAFKSWSYVGVDPTDQLLIGPALAMPRALERAGLDLCDVDLVDMHEAFAAQVLSVLKVLKSDSFAQHRLGRETAVGEVDPSRLNVHGGSIAIGHPFGATGARLVTTVANRLQREGGRFGLIAACSFLVLQIWCAPYMETSNNCLAMAALASSSPKPCDGVRRCVAPPLPLHIKDAAVVARRGADADGTATRATARPTPSLLAAASSAGAAEHNRS